MRNLRSAKRSLRHTLALSMLVTCFTACQEKGASQSDSESSGVSLWLTSPDQTALFERQDTSMAFKSAPSQLPTIEVNATETYQNMDGFGFSLTGGSALLLHQMTPAKRAALLEELFGTEGNNIGISYLRVSIGASDLDPHVFSYNDLPPGETDVMMEKFDLSPDKKYLIPALKEILAINPDIKLMGSPWSPPTWMKTNYNSVGGSLKPEFYDAYARYFVKYIQGMAAEGITIDAITVQNEPLHPDNNPSLLMQAHEQAAFVKQSLGPAFQAASLMTKIVIYDHNADRPDYPISILDDPEAKPYIDGSAFHLYGGTIDALSKVHEAHPDKNVYFTEQWIGAPGNFAGDVRWHTRNLIIGAPRNWSRTVLEWNLAADPQQKPHTPGGCTECLGAFTLNGDAVTRNPAYYIVAHASKFVRPGSVRIKSSMPEALPNVAYKTPDGQHVLIVLNESDSPQHFTISQQGKQVTSALPAGAVGTYVW